MKKLGADLISKDLAADILLIRMSFLSASSVMQLLNFSELMPSNFAMVSKRCVKLAAKAQESCVLKSALIVLK